MTQFCSFQTEALLTSLRLDASTGSSESSLLETLNVHYRHEEVHDPKCCHQISFQPLVWCPLLVSPVFSSPSSLFHNCHPQHDTMIHLMLPGDETSVNPLPQDMTCLTFPTYPASLPSVNLGFNSSCCPCWTAQWIMRPIVQCREILVLFSSTNFHSIGWKGRYL